MVDSSPDQAGRPPREPMARIAELELVQEGVRRALGHDVSSQLRNVDQLAQLANESLTAAPEDAHECLVRIVSCVRRMQEIESSLRAYLAATAPPQPLGAVSAADAATRAIDATRTLCADAGCVATVTGDGSVFADLDALSDVLARLIDNAVRRGGARKIALRVEPSAEDGRVALTVSDDGVGVPAAFAPRVFAPFERMTLGEASSATAHQAGLGLGLAICRAALTRMGGAIALAPPPVSGARFELTLARAP